MPKIRKVMEVRNPDFELPEGHRIFETNDQPPLYALTIIKDYGDESMRWVRALGPLTKEALQISLAVFDDTQEVEEAASAARLEELQEANPATRGWDLAWEDGLIISGEYPGGDDLLVRNVAALALGAGRVIES